MRSGVRTPYSPPHITGRQLRLSPFFFAPLRCLRCVQNLILPHDLPTLRISACPCRRTHAANSTPRSLNSQARLTLVATALIRLNDERRSDVKMASLQAKRRLAPSQQERTALACLALACLAQRREDAEKAVDCPAIGVLPRVIRFDHDALLLRGQEISLNL